MPAKIQTLFTFPFQRMSQEDNLFNSQGQILLSGLKLDGVEVRYSLLLMARAVSLVEQRLMSFRQKLYGSYFTEYLTLQVEGSRSNCYLVMTGGVSKCLRNNSNWRW